VRRIRLLVPLLVALLLGPAPLPSTLPALAVEDAPRIGMYRGLGSWVDIYELGAFRHAGRTIRRMARHGVRTLYVETSNFHRPRAIMWPNGIGRFIDAAHERGMKVVAWYLPGFRDLALDLRRSTAAITFRSPEGDTFDSFALDIESPEVRSAERRTRRLLRLSRDIRDRVGAAYPLGAIVPSPRGVELNPDYWPGFPYRELNAIYDVFVPMTYFSWRTQGPAGAHGYTSRNIRIIRRETGDRDVPIHVIGGLGSGTSGREAEAFVHALREHGVVGGSLYNFSETEARHWSELRAIPVNPIQSPALPVQVGYDPALGNIPGGDRSHPKEVFYRTGAVAGARVLRFEAWNVDAGEVEIWVNWRRVGDVAPTLPGLWSEPRTVPIPDDFLRNGGTNLVSFVAAGDFPAWSEWGVRSVSLDAPAP
jgi:hypothetical protein